MRTDELRALTSACKGHVFTHSFTGRNVYRQQYRGIVKLAVMVMIEETENCL